LFYTFVSVNNTLGNFLKKILCTGFILCFLQLFEADAQFVLNGNATIVEPKCSDSTITYQLTPDLNNQAGEIWYPVRVSLAQRFDVQFEMYLGVKQYSVGADGICFVFQQQSVNAGSNGGGLGYMGITPSIAVEFDTYHNAWDPLFCHTAIEKNGDVFHNDNSGNNLAGPLQLDPANPNLPDGNWHHMEIIWNPVSDSLTVYYDCTFRIAYQGDIIDSIFGGNPNVYWGFTAGTGGSDNVQQVCLAHSYLNNLRDTTVCRGNPVKLVATGGSSYQWSPSKGLNVDTGAVVIATPDTTTTYRFVAKGCVGIIKDSATITVKPGPSGNISKSKNILCNGEDNGSASVSVTGGIAVYTYLWSPTGGSTATATGLSAGTYTVTVNTPNGCEAIETVAITQPPAITPTLNLTTATCLNNDGAISISVSGGNSPYTYSWSPGGSTNPTLTGLSFGQYKVTITDANNCIDTISGDVGIDKNFSVTVTGPTDTVCIGQSITLSASGATNYLWSNTGTSASTIVNPKSDTSYWVVATTGVCSDSIPYKINVYKELSSTLVPNDSICSGIPVTLKLKVSGGKPVYAYSWSSGTTNNTPGPVIVYPTSTTTYSVNITDECNYRKLDTVTVKVFSAGSASFYSIPVDTIRSGQTVTFSNNSQNNTSYFWNFGDGDSSVLVSPTHIYGLTGIYKILLIGYTANGCPDTAIEDIFVQPEIYIPNVFTPNGDGKNDVIYFIVAGARCYHCDIYDRWGIFIDEVTASSEGWDGKVQQTKMPAPDGTYYYILNYCDYKNVTHNLNGFVTLIRNK